MTPNWRILEVFVGKSRLQDLPCLWERTPQSWIKGWKDLKNERKYTLKSKIFPNGFAFYQTTHHDPAIAEAKCRCWSLLPCHGCHPHGCGTSAAQEAGARGYDKGPEPASTSHQSRPGKKIHKDSTVGFRGDTHNNCFWIYVYLAASNLNCKRNQSKKTNRFSAHTMTMIWGCSICAWSGYKARPSQTLIRFDGVSVCGPAKC